VVYAPFGEVRIGEPSDLTDFGFTGQRRDDSTGGLMYYGARYYLPSLRRFISADTIVPGAGNPQNLNRYSYVLNNPVNLIDPTGHRPPTDEEDQWWGMDGNHSGGGGSGSSGGNAAQGIGNATGGDYQDPRWTAHNEDRGEASAEPQDQLWPYIDLGEDGQTIGDWFTFWGFVLDETSTALSLLEFVDAEAGCAAGGSLAGPGGCGGGAIAAFLTVRTLENLSNYTSTFLTVTGDIVLDRSGIDFESGTLVIGGDTIADFAATGLGLGLQAELDLGANFAEVEYDGFRINGTIPDWGIAIPIPDPLLDFLRTRLN
jgi:RHS repeat-associated protein